MKTIYREEVNSGYYKIRLNVKLPCLKNFP